MRGKRRRERREWGGRESTFLGVWMRCCLVLSWPLLRCGLALRVDNSGFRWNGPKFTFTLIPL